MFDRLLKILTRKVSTRRPSPAETLNPVPMAPELAHDAREVIEQAQTQIMGELRRTIDASVSAWTQDVESTHEVVKTLRTVAETLVGDLKTIRKHAIDSKLPKPNMLRGEAAQTLRADLAERLRASVRSEYEHINELAPGLIRLGRGSDFSKAQISTIEKRIGAQVEKDNANTAPRITELLEHYKTRAFRAVETQDFSDDETAKKKDSSQRMSPGQLAKLVGAGQREIAEKFFHDLTSLLKKDVDGNHLPLPLFSKGNPVSLELRKHIQELSQLKVTVNAERHQLAKRVERAPNEIVELAISELTQRALQKISASVYSGSTPTVQSYSLSELRTHPLQAVRDAERTLARTGELLEKIRLLHLELQQMQARVTDGEGRAEQPLPAMFDHYQTQARQGAINDQVLCFWAEQLHSSPDATYLRTKHLLLESVLVTPNRWSKGDRRALNELAAMGCCTAVITDRGTTKYGRDSLLTFLDNEDLRSTEERQW